MTCENCVRLLGEIKQLEAQVSKLKMENEELKRRLQIYENPNVPPSRRRYPTRPRSNSGKRFPGRPKGCPGKTRPTPKPNVVKGPEWNGCEVCGSPLGWPDYVGHRVVEEISNPMPKTVIDFLIFEGECDVCGAYNVARHPDCPPDGRFGKNVYVQTTLMKFKERLPLEKVSDTLERTYGLSVVPATILELTRRVSEWLKPEYKMIQQRIRGAHVVYIDETGHYVDGEKHWLWIFTTETETFIVIRKRRSESVLEEVLGEDFAGFIVCDGWRSYPTFTRKIQRDWAHLLREADWLAERTDRAKPLQKALHRLYNQLKLVLEDDPPPEERITLARKAKGRLRYWTRKRYRNKEIKDFIQKIRNGFEYWFTFVTNPGIEPTNNRAEQALREHVVQRKIMGTFRNYKGTAIYETITTLLATWKQQGFNLSEKLAESLSRDWARRAQS